MTGASQPSGAVLISIGDELLLGRTVDTNATWLGRSLADLGIRVGRGYSVPDDDVEIGAALASACSDAALVILTGGLGPTRDDHTREAVASATGLGLTPNPAVEAHLEEYYASRGRELPQIARKIALVHDGALVFLNPAGTAPAILLRHGESEILLLPGVPREMRALFELAAPEITARLAGRLPRLAVRGWTTSGIGESALAPLLDGALEDAGLLQAVAGHPWELAYLPGLRGVGLRATMQFSAGVDEEAALQTLAEVIEPVIAPWRIPESPTGDVVGALADALIRSGQTLATAESCTGGLVSKRLTDLAGSSAWFLGGVVAYSNPAKLGLLGVDKATLDSLGAVSERVAEQMARGAARVLGTDAGIGITGIAGPGGGSEDKPVGTVCYAVSLGSRCEVRREVFGGDREAVRERSAQASLMLLLRMLEDRELVS